MASLFPRIDQPDDHIAVAIGGRTLTYRALRDAACAHARALERLGVARGSHVAVWAQPALETVVALVGNALAGVVSVPVNPASGARELNHVLTDAAPIACFAADPSAVHLADGAAVIHPARIVGASATAERAPNVDDAPLLVLYTSGTTGAPKGAVLTARNVASNLDALARAWNWHDTDTLVHALPVFHVHGLVLGMLGTLRVGGSVRWHPRFEAAAIANEFRTGATMLFGVPTMYHRLADALERDDDDCARSMARARLLVSGSAPLPVREHGRIERACGQRIVERYGLTETLINCSVRHDGDRRAGCVGPALEGVAVRLVDEHRTEVLARDGATLGEIAVRGPNVFAGYLHRNDATRAVTDSDGWFYTGDLAAIEPDGYVRIVGRRATDLIKTGGFKVGAGEIEAALLEHAAVREAAVFAVADDDLGEKIVACLVLCEGRSASADELTQHVAQSLAPHKRPRVIRFVAELPRNAMGKVLKSELRSREIA